MSKETDLQAQDEHHRQLLLELEVMQAQLLRRKHLFPSRNPVSTPPGPDTQTKPSNIIPFRRPPP